MECQSLIKMHSEIDNVCVYNNRIPSKWGSFDTVDNYGFLQNVILIAWKPGLQNFGKFDFEMWICYFLNLNTCK